jgi:hypothetical protein
MEASLENLRKEVSDLEAEKKKILTQQQRLNNSCGQVPAKQLPATGGGANSSLDLKLKKELKEKSQLLEQKLQLLRQKENECNKLNVQKEKSTQELDNLQKQLADSNKSKVDLMKKMREEGHQHMLDRQKQSHSDAQSRRREMIAQIKLAKMEKQMVQKEMVWREQLQKEKVKQQQQATLATARQQNASDKLARKQAAAASSALLSSAKVGSTQQQQLETAVDEELQRQAKLQGLRNQLTTTMNKRTTIAKQLANIKLSPVPDAHAIDDLDKQMKLLSAEIASFQANIANCETSKLADITNIGESKAVIGMLITKLLLASKAVVPEKQETTTGDVSSGDANKVSQPAKKPVIVSGMNRSKMPMSTVSTNKSQTDKVTLAPGAKPTVRFDAASGNGKPKIRLPLHAPKPSTASQHPAIPSKTMSALGSTKSNPVNISLVANANAARQNKLAATFSSLDALTAALATPAVSMAQVTAATNESESAAKIAVVKETEDEEEEEEESYDEIDEENDQYSDYSSEGGHDEMDESFYPDEEDIEEEDDDDYEDSFRARRNINRRKNNLRCNRRVITDDEDVDNLDTESIRDRTSTESSKSADSNMTEITNNARNSSGSDRVYNTEGDDNDENASDADSQSESDEAEDYSDSDDSTRRNRRRKQTTKKSNKKTAVPQQQKVKAVDAIDLTEIVSKKPLIKHTVPELKEILRCHGLPVGGVKDELIKRLEQYAIQSHAGSSDNDENCEQNHIGANAVDRAFLIDTITSNEENEEIF